MDKDQIKKVTEGDEGAVASSNGDVAKAGEGSILNAIRSKRQAMSKDRKTIIDIPGYDGMLVAEYRVIPYDQMSKLMNKAASAKDSQGELNAVTDVLVRACHQILVRDESGKLEPLNEAVPEFGDDPVRYDLRLAQAAEVTGDRARLICQNVFNNDLALVDHNNTLVEWMKSSEREEADTFLKN